MTAIDGEKLMVWPLLLELANVHGRSQKRNRFTIEEVLAVLLVIINL